jgi:hypothetical protein
MQDIPFINSKLFVRGIGEQFAHKNKFIIQTGKLDSRIIYARSGAILGWEIGRLKAPPMEHQCSRLD